PQPPAPRPIDNIEDDEGYRSTHSSEDEEDYVIAEIVEFVDFIAVTDNMEDGDEGSEQSVNKPTIWEVGMKWPNIDMLRQGEDKKNVQCPWVAYFRRQDDKFTMRLNTLKAVHTCKADCDMFNRMANANWVVRKIEDQMKGPDDWVLLPRKVEWVEYCSSCFWVSEYNLAYMSNVKPMKDVKDWPKLDPTELVKPPPLVRGIGRTKKQRMHAEDENDNGHVQ
ncbi:hypothetical protein IFM89_029332, partial [Coptis chinensis]